MIERIRNWWRGYHNPFEPGEVDVPARCQCGHYLYIHEDDGCGANAYDQWLRWGPVMILLGCRCKIRKLAFHD